MSLDTVLLVGGAVLIGLEMRFALSAARLLCWRPYRRCCSGLYRHP